MHSLTTVATLAFAVSVSAGTFKLPIRSSHGEKSAVGTFGIRAGWPGQEPFAGKPFSPKDEIDAKKAVWINWKFLVVLMVLMVEW